MRVLKFGGKSLETKEKFSSICNYIKSIYEKDRQLIVVVSAIGNTTDKLINLSQTFGNNISSNRELAILLSTGETQSAALLSMKLNSIGVSSKSFSARDIKIITHGDYNNSIITSIEKNKLLDCINKNIVAVVAGFQGINNNDEITTLGRGGSDTTAVAIASIFNCDAEIYSDFDGIFAGDPKILNYKKLNYINFDTMIKMSEEGAKVLDEKATKLAKEKNTTIICKSSAEPYKDGSIVSNLNSDTISICYINNLSKISIVYSNSNKLKFIIKNVFLCLINYKFYNFIINSNSIEFFIESKNLKNILFTLSNKLNLLN